MEKRFLLSRRQLLVSTVGLAVSACKPEDAAIVTTNSDVIDGYMQEQSYAPGDVALIYVNAKTQGRQKLSLQDVNGQEVFSFEAQVQPQVVANAQPWADGFGYVNPVIVTTPNVKSGIYFWNGKIRCIIRAQRNTTPSIVVVYPSNTEHAYSAMGGKSLYYPAGDLAVQVSFHRPWSKDVYFFSKSYYEWLVTQGDYNVGYLSDYDMDDYENIRGAKLLVVIGHSEYWTRTARLNFDRFVDEGCHALVLSGNTMWWQVRYSENRDRMICYRGVSDPAAPVGSLLRTINWFDPSLKYPILSSIGADMNYGGFGFRYPDLGWDGMRIVSASSPIFKGLNIKNGDILPLRTSEYDGAPLSGFTANGDPIIDNVKLGFYRVDLIGFDRGFYKVDTTATWMVFQKKPASGFVLNGASTDWGSTHGIGGADSVRFKIIVRNMMDLLLQDIYPI